MSLRTPSKSKTKATPPKVNGNEENPSLLEEIKSPPVLAPNKSSASNKSQWLLAEGKLFPGDFVVYRSKFPLDMLPTYGIVLDPNSDLAKSARAVKSFMIKDMGDGRHGKYFVCWDKTQNVQLVTRQELILIDRPLQRGQCVGNLDGLKGVVTDLSVKMTLNILQSNDIVENIPMYKLYPFTNYVRGQDILYRGWVGTITTVLRHLNFRLSSGNILYVEAEETDGFMNNDPYCVVGAQCPGNQVRLPPSVLKRSKLINRSLKRFIWNFPGVAYLYAMDTFTILRPQVIGITVNWLCQNPFEVNVSPKCPPTYLPAAEFQRFAVPIGNPSAKTMKPESIRLYRVENSDTIKDHKTWFTDFHTKFMTLAEISLTPRNTGHGQERAPNHKIKYSVKGKEVKVRPILRQTMAEIEWEDGRTEEILTSHIPYIFPFEDDTAYRTGLIVATAFPKRDNIYGIVHPSQADYKMVQVRWIRIPEDKDEEAEDRGIREESIYDLRPHQEYCVYKPGTVVFLKKEIEGLKAGTVVDLDLRKGRMLVASPMHQQSFPVWPHLVKPLSKRCCWNFFVKSWIIDNFIPPTYQIEIPFRVQEREAVHEPIQLNISNNNILDKLDSCLKEEPQFLILDHAPKSHFFYDHKPPKFKYLRNFNYEIKLLTEKTPDGIWIRSYGDRLDLLSLLFLGPQNTPYEDGLFMFDLQLPADFPQVPPKIRYISYSMSISPLIDAYDGEFCMSSLNWNSTTGRQLSGVLTAVERIQYVLFHREPYFDAYNIPLENRSPQNLERSRAYNEKVFINVLSALHSMAQNPHDPWRRHISQQLSLMLPHKVKFLKKILAQDSDVFDKRTYPLFPVSRAFELSLLLRVSKLEELIQNDVAAVDQNTLSSGSINKSLFQSSLNDWQSVKITQSRMEILPKDSENNISDTITATFKGNKDKDGKPDADFEVDDNDEKKSIPIFTENVKTKSKRNKKKKSAKKLVLVNPTLDGDIETDTDLENLVEVSGT